MDYYTRNRNARTSAQKRADRIETIKTALTVVVTLPLLWLITVMFLCI